MYTDLLKRHLQLSDAVQRVHGQQSANGRSIPEAGSNGKQQRQVSWSQDSHFLYAAIRVEHQINTCSCVHMTTSYAVSLLQQLPTCKQNKTANA